MQLDPAVKGPVANRLKRAQGQINGVLRMLEDDRECTDVAIQLAAASQALKQAGFTLIAAGLGQCAVAGDEGKTEQAKLERLFLSFG